VKSTQWYFKKGFGITETNGSRVLTGIKQNPNPMGYLPNHMYISAQHHQYLPCLLKTRLIIFLLKEIKKKVK
jgi:hypothetical protein